MPKIERAPANCLSISQAAKFLNCSEQLVAKLIKRKQLRAIKVGRRIAIPPESIAKFIADNPAA